MTRKFRFAASFAAGAFLAGAIAWLAAVELRVDPTGDEGRVVESVEISDATPQSTPGTSTVQPVCLQAVDTALSVPVPTALELLASSNIEAILQDIAATNSLWNELQLGLPPEVRIGCPSAPLPILVGEPFEGVVPRGNFRQHSVAQPSGYSLFIYIMPKDEIERWLMTPVIRVVPQEFVCGGDYCSSTANALYLTPEEAQLPNDYLRSALERGLGLRLADPSNGP